MSDMLQVKEILWNKGHSFFSKAYRCTFVRESYGANLSGFETNMD